MELAEERRMQKANSASPGEIAVPYWAVLGHPQESLQSLLAALAPQAPDRCQVVQARAEAEG